MKFKLEEKRRKKNKHQLGYFTTFMRDPEKEAEIFNTSVDFSKVDGNTFGGVTADGGNAVSESLENISDFIDKAEVILVDDAKNFDINKWERDLQKEIDEEVEEETEEQTKEGKFVKYKIDGATLKKVIDKLSNSSFSTLDGVTSWKTKQFLKKNNLTLDDLQYVLRNIKEEDYKTNSIPSNKNEGYNEAIIFLKTTKIKELEPMRLYIKLDYDNIEETPVIIISVHKSGKVKVEGLITEKSAYHYGDLDVAKKAEKRSQMSGGRSTGHFGTGFYALSKPDTDSYGYSQRDVWEVDLDKYNLFKPKSEREAYDLHECLAMINTSVDFNSYDEDEIIDKFDSISDKFVRGEDNKEVKDELKSYLLDQGFNADYVDYIMWSVDEERFGEADKRIKQYIRDNDEDISRMIKAEDRLCEIFGKDVSEAFREAVFSESQEDSKSTVFMKNLGYEGIDVTDLEQLDNFRYGSVIYDLKPNTYKKIEKTISESVETDRIKKLFDECVSELRRIGYQVDDDIDLKFNNAKTFFGKTTTLPDDGNRFTITLSRYLDKETDDFVKDIIYHELSHYITSRKAIKERVLKRDRFGEWTVFPMLKKYYTQHGEIWKKIADDICSKLGCHIERVHDSDTTDDIFGEDMNYEELDRKEALRCLEDIEEEETAKCVWCGDEFPVSDLHKEKDMGYLCDNCKRGIESRGEKLEFEDEYDDIKSRRDESIDKKNESNDNSINGYYIVRRPKGVNDGDQNRYWNGSYWSTSQSGARLWTDLEYAKLNAKSFRLRPDNKDFNIFLAEVEDGDIQSYLLGESVSIDMSDEIRDFNKSYVTSDKDKLVMSQLEKLNGVYRVRKHNDNVYLLGVSYSDSVDSMKKRLDDIKSKLDSLYGSDNYAIDYSEERGWGGIRPYPFFVKVSDDVLTESLNESSMLIDEFSISDNEKLKIYWDKNDGYVVEKIYNQGNDLWRTDFKKTFHDELSAKRYFSRAKKKFGVNESASDDFNKFHNREVIQYAGTEEFEVLDKLRSKYGCKFGAKGVGRVEVLGDKADKVEKDFGYYKFNGELPESLNKDKVVSNFKNKFKIIEKSDKDGKYYKLVDNENNTILSDKSYRKVYREYIERTLPLRDDGVHINTDGDYYDFS